MARQASRNPNRTRWFALALLLLGFGAIAVDFLQCPDGSDGSAFRIQGVWGGVGLCLVGIALVSWLTVYFTSRCPFCGKWIDPWYFPRRGVHCPKCGKTTQ